MNRINKILLISLAISSVNAFAIDGLEEKDTSFYLKGLGGGTYSHDIDIENKGPNYAKDKFESDFSGFAQIGLGVKYQPMRASFEIDYIKPFGSKFTMKDSDQLFKKDSVSVKTKTGSMTAGEIKESLLKELDAATSKDQAEQIIIRFVDSRNDVSLGVTRNNMIESIKNNFEEQPNDHKKEFLVKQINELGDEKFNLDQSNSVVSTSSPVTKSEVTMELEDYHVFLGRVSFDIIDKDNYSLYISAGGGFSYFGGNIKIQVDAKSPDGQVNQVTKVKFKPDFYPTGLVGLGMGYKINDSMSLIAQYDFTFTSADLMSEKTERTETINGVAETPVMLDRKEKIGKIDLYNHNFGVGLKIQF